MLLDSFPQLFTLFTTQSFLTKSIHLTADGAYLGCCLAPSVLIMQHYTGVSLGLNRISRTFIHKRVPEHVVWGVLDTILIVTVESLVIFLHRAMILT